MCQTKPGIHVVAESERGEVRDDFMAADETFSSVEALQEAIAKDVEQRIATAHLRLMPSKVTAIQHQGTTGAPGELRQSACAGCPC